MDPTKAKPAILVVGNVEASHVVGVELALRVAKQLIEKGGSDDKFRAFLDAYTVYVIPSPTPDATEKNFSISLREFDGNSVRTDDDRDFEIGEDPPMDLNGDGLITLMRIEDELGTHRVHPDDPRIRRKITRPDHVTIAGDGFSVVLAETSNDLLFRNSTTQTLKPATVKLPSIDGNSIVYVRWIVSGSGAGRIIVDSIKGGTAQAELNLKN